MEYLFYGFLILLCWQFGGMLILALRVWYPEAKTSELPITLVICSNGKRESLFDLLVELNHQYYKNFRVLVVADRWGEAEIEQLNSLPHVTFQIDDLEPITYPLYQTEVLFIEEIPQGWDAKKYLIDRAVSFSETEYLLFTDDDCLPASPYWINHMAAEWEKGADIIVGFSPYDKKPGLLNLLYRFETYTLGLQFLTAGIQKLPYMALGRNMGYTKTFYYAVNGMESINGYKGGDDDLLTNKGAKDAKWGFALSPDALVFSEPVPSFKAWQNQKLRHFKAGTRYSQRQWYVGLLAFLEIIRLPLLAALCIWDLELGMLAVLLRVLLYNGLQWWLAKYWKLGFNWLQIVLADLVYPILYLYFGVLAYFNKTEKQPW
jgi:cellulose synthase/poly-beta-1,6-N-acetylglucosamine synthase-like glycosyltransferase